MGKKIKKLCKYEKEKLKDHLDDIKEVVGRPSHICLKCGRVANDTNFLCKPDKLFV